MKIFKKEKICEKNKKCDVCSLKENKKEKTFIDKILTESDETVEFERNKGVKYKDPYFINLVWTTIKSNPNISSTELWKILHPLDDSSEYLGDTRTFQALLFFMLSKKYIKKGIAKPGFKTAWDVLNKPVYSITGNKGKLKEAIIKENQKDIEFTYPILQDMTDNLKMLRDVKPEGSWSFECIQAMDTIKSYIHKLKRLLRDDTERRNN